MSTEQNKDSPVNASEKLYPSIGGSYSLTAGQVFDTRRILRPCAGRKPMIAYREAESSEPQATHEDPKPWGLLTNEELDECLHLACHPYLTPLLDYVDALDQRYGHRNIRDVDVAPAWARRKSFYLEAIDRMVFCLAQYRINHRYAGRKLSRANAASGRQESLDRMVGPDALLRVAVPHDNFQDNGHDLRRASGQEIAARIRQGRQMGVHARISRSDPPAVHSDLTTDPDVEARRERPRQLAVSQWTAPPRSSHGSLQGKSRSAPLPGHHDALPPSGHPRASEQRLHNADVWGPARRAQGASGTGTIPSRSLRGTRQVISGSNEQAFGRRASQVLFTALSAQRDYAPCSTPDATALIESYYVETTEDQSSLGKVTLPPDDTTLPGGSVSTQSEPAVQVSAQGPADEITDTIGELRTPLKTHTDSFDDTTQDTTENSPHVRWGDALPTAMDSGENPTHNDDPENTIERPKTPFPSIGTLSIVDAGADADLSDLSSEFSVVDVAVWGDGEDPLLTEAPDGVRVPK